MMLSKVNSEAATEIVWPTSSAVSSWPSCVHPTYHTQHMTTNKGGNIKTPKSSESCIQSRTRVFANHTEVRMYLHTSNPKRAVKILRYSSSTSVSTQMVGLVL